MRMVVAAMLLAAPLAACATTGADAPVTETGACNNEAVAGFVGQTVTADLGAQMLKASGAKALRWGAPNMAMTMDFRPDRLTVSYDAQMVIISARCG
jgi:hypothetical protein